MIPKTDPKFYDTNQGEKVYELRNINLNVTNNNTNDYANTKNKEDDLLSTNIYNLSEDDKKNALQALKTLKEIEDKINKKI